MVINIMKVSQNMSPSTQSLDISIRTLFLWNVLVFLSTSATPTTGPNSDLPVLLNSTLACTRGADQRLHQLTCDNGNGTTGLLALNRLFYGTTPKTSECSLKAPYENCCGQDPDKNCVFKSDFKMDTISVKCSGKPNCRFYGQSVMTSRGNCSTEIFTSITSFSFLEYSCLSQENLINVCPKEENSTAGLKLYLDSNYKYVNDHVGSGEDCTCVLYTQCGVSIIVEAILVQLRRINSTDCVEEITVQDLKNESNVQKYSCLDHDRNMAINNQVMLTSTSNAVLLRLHIFEKHNGKILISAISSDSTSSLSIKCGPGVSDKSLPSEYYCSGEIIPDFPDDVTTTEPNGESDNDNGDIDETEGGNAVAVNKESEELHSGAIAGIVLAIVGILLVVSQVIYYIIKRHQKIIDQREDRSVNGGSSLSPHQMVNPAFVPNSSGRFEEDDYHVYDIANGTTRGRPSGRYASYIPRDDTMPEKDVTDLSRDDDDAHEYVDVLTLDDYMSNNPPPPYDITRE